MELIPLTPTAGVFSGLCEVNNIEVAWWGGTARGEVVFIGL